MQHLNNIKHINMKKKLPQIHLLGCKSQNLKIRKDQKF